MAQHHMAIEHVANWLFVSNSIVFTGRMLNANKMAKPRDVFEMCLKHDADFWKHTYGYRSKTRPGQNGGIYRIFRDEVLLPALCVCRTRQLNVAGELAPERYLYKNAMLRNADCAPRAILGWEAVPDLGSIAREYSECA